MRIYLNENTKQVFIDNEEPRFAESYINIWQGEYFELWLKGNPKKQFKEIWSNVQDVDGNGFETREQAIEYLSVVFETQKLGTHKEYGEPYYDFELDIKTLLTF